MLKASQIDQQVRFEVRTGSTDDAGNYLPGDWQLFCSSFAYYRSTYAREINRVGRPHGEQTATLTMWRDPVADAITTDMRAVLMGSPYGTPSGRVAAIIGVQYDDPHEMTVTINVGANP